MARKVLFDVDPGCDDALMLLVALAAEDIEVVGVTTAAGNTTLGNATRNALAVLEFAGRTDVPVAAGAHRPLVDQPVTAEEVHGEGGLRVDLPDPEAEPIDAHAVEFIREQAREHGDELTIAEVAPQTNLALALATAPELPGMVDEIYVMGGNADRTGNVTPMAAFNIYADAHAASRVFQDAGGVRMVGLEVAEAAYLPLGTLRRWEDAGDPLATIAGLFSFTVEEAREKYGIEGAFMHDVLVAADLIGSVIDYEEYYMEVDTTGGPSHGAVIWDEYDVLEGEPNVALGVDIDVEACNRIVTDALERWAG